MWPEPAGLHIPDIFDGQNDPQSKLEIKVIKRSLTTSSKKPTITDVARMAEVSIKTVSRVANGEANVREETRARVQRAIDALGYVANPYARYLSLLRAEADRAASPRLAEEAGR